MIPVKLYDITPTWLSEVTDLTVSETNFQLTANVQEGTGFLSNLIRVSGQTESGEPVRVVVKLQPEGELLQYLVAMRMDESEIKCYKEILPQIVEQCPDLKENLCGFIYGAIEERPDSSYTSVLVLEDLKPQGYKTFDFKQNITIYQVEECVTFLAKLHFASYSLENLKETPLDQVFPNLERIHGQELIQLLGSSFKILDTFVEANSPSLSNLKDLSPIYAQIFEAFVTTKITEYPCLIHTDLWANNVLFNVDNNEPIKVIDWQVASYNDPVFDLVTAVLTSLPAKDLTMRNVEIMLQLYYDAFVLACKGSRISTKTFRSYEELSEYFFTYGMGWALIWVVFSVEPLSANKKRLVRILEFLELEVGVTKFLMELVKGK